MTAPQSPPICDYTGDWTLSFNAICEPSLGSNCPLPQNVVTGRREQLVTVTYHLTSEDFCPRILADVPVSASLTSYQDAGHSIPKDDFLHGARTYWLAQAASPSATIVEVSTKSVSSDNTLLYSDTPFSQNGINFAVTNFLRATGTEAGVSDHPTQSWFAFDLNPNTFLVAADQSAPFAISVTLNVVFLNTDPASAPVVRTLTFQPLMAGAETTASEVGASHSLNLVSTSSSSIAASPSVLSQNAFIGVVVGGVAFVIILASVLVYVCRRSRKSTEQPAVGLEGVVAHATAQTNL